MRCGGRRFKSAFSYHRSRSLCELAPPAAVPRPVRGGHEHDLLREVGARARDGPSVFSRRLVARPALRVVDRDRLLDPVSVERDGGSDPAAVRASQTWPTCAPASESPSTAPGVVNNSVTISMSVFAAAARNFVRSASRVARSSTKSKTGTRLVGSRDRPRAIPVAAGRRHRPPPSAPTCRSAPTFGVCSPHFVPA